MSTEAAQASAATLAPGAIVAERYRVEAVLGEGGMGVVYLAEHVHMRKRVALKVLLPRWKTTPEVLARFEREAVTAGSIAHPNVAAATDFGQLPDGSFFLVLEYVEGKTLRSLIGAGPLPPARAIAIASGIASGIAAAHARGVIHRDLKPENVMLVTRGDDPDFVKVLDFGIAKLALAESSGVALTAAGAILGTPDYMAPEQATGEGVDARADLYAVGIILFELLSGECPFRGGAVTVIRQHVLCAAPPLPPGVAERVPAPLRAVIGRLLEKDPNARYATASELLAALDECMRLVRLVPGAAPPGGLAGSPLTAPERVTGSARKTELVRTFARPVAWAYALAAATTILVAAVALAFGHTSPRRDDPPRAVPPPYVALPPPQPSHTPLLAPLLAPRPAPSDVPPQPAASSTRHAPARRTGPGGIYIPPPSHWFN